MELNVTEGVMHLKCAPCHQYIVDEMSASNKSYGWPDGVYWKHYNALADPNYVYYDGSTELDFPAAPPLFGGSKMNVCQVCHIMEQDALTLDNQHTGLTIRACTDDDCHGNSSHRGAQSPLLDSDMKAAGYVGKNLTNPSDLHSSWFDEMEQRQSTYKNEDGGYYSQGFYVCLGCHTHVGISFNITRPTEYRVNLSMQGGVSNSAQMDEVKILETNKNTSITIAVPGTKWG